MSTAATSRRPCSSAVTWRDTSSCALFVNGMRVGSSLGAAECCGIGPGTALGCNISLILFAFLETRVVLGGIPPEVGHIHISRFPDDGGKLCDGVPCLVARMGGLLYPNSCFVRAYVTFPGVHLGEVDDVKASLGARFHSPVVRVRITRGNRARFALFPRVESRWTQHRCASLAVVLPFYHVRVSAKLFVGLRHLADNGERSSLPVFSVRRPY